MKRVLFSAAAALFTLGATAQTDGMDGIEPRGGQGRRAEIRVTGTETGADSSVVRIDSYYARRYSPDHDAMSIRVGDYDMLLETRRMSRARRGKYQGRIGSIEIGLNNLRETPESYLMYDEAERGFMDIRMSKSVQFVLNVWTFSTAITHDNTVGVTGAVGIVANNYRFAQAAAFAHDNSRRMVTPIETTHSLSKSKMTTFAIHFPLAVEVNPSRDFFFSAGGWVDLVTGSHMKWKSPKRKLRRLSPNVVQAGVTARVGFRNAYFYSSYNFVELFAYGRGPVFNPYTFGIGFGF